MYEHIFTIILTKIYCTANLLCAVMLKCSLKTISGHNTTEKDFSGRYQGKSVN